MKKEPAPGEHLDDQLRAELAEQVVRWQAQGQSEEALLLDLVRSAQPAFKPDQDEVQRAYRIALESGLKPIHIANVLAFLWNRRDALHRRRREHSQKESKP